MPYLLLGTPSYRSQGRFPVGTNFRAKEPGAEQTWHQRSSLRALSKRFLPGYLESPQVSCGDPCLS